MAKRITTLFIRDNGIYLLVMNGRRVDKWASSPLEPGLVSQGLIIDDSQVAERVRQLFKETGAKTAKVITAISGHESLYRIVTLPELPDAILPEAVKREARRTIPTSLEEVYLSYQRLASERSGESRIFLAAFPRNLVDALMRTLRQAGVRPSVLDLAPLALCRVPNEPRAIIVNARLEHVDVVVVAERLPQVVRRITLPGETESVEEKASLIAEEFNRTISFYNSTHIEKPLDSTVPVFVCGDLADKPELWPAVVGHAGYTVSPLPSPVETPEGFNANEFMVNIGLALKELLPEKGEANFSIVNFNALPEAYVPPPFSIARVLIPVGIAIGIGLIIFGIVFTQNARSNAEALRSQLATTRASVAQLQAEIAGLNAQVKSVGAVANELNGRLVAMERGRATTQEDLKQIVTLASQKVSLGSVKYGGSSVSIEGVSSTENAIFGYARDLRKGGRFSRVWISSITFDENSRQYSFSLALTK